MQSHLHWSKRAQLNLQLSHVLSIHPSWLANYLPQTGALFYSIMGSQIRPSGKSLERNEASFSPRSKPRIRTPPLRITNTSREFRNATCSCNELLLLRLAAPPSLRPLLAASPPLLLAVCDLFSQHVVCCVWIEGGGGRRGQIWELDAME